MIINKKKKAAFNITLGLKKVDYPLGYGSALVDFGETRDGFGFVYYFEDEFDFGEDGRKILKSAIKNFIKSLIDERVAKEIFDEIYLEKYENM